MNPASLTSTTSHPDDDLAELFRRLAEVTPAERQAVIDDFLRGHPDRKQEVEDLLGAQEQLIQAAPPPTTAAPVLLGPFRIVRRLPGGGMGEVYEAREDRLERSVIVKVIRRGQADAPTRARFDNEQKVLARLHHTHIVAIFASGEENGVQYFAMPYIDGANLRDVVGAARQGEPMRARGRMPDLSTLVEKAAHLRETPPEESAPHTPATVPATTGAEDGRPGPTPRLSTAYLRSAARILADAAEAVQSIHDAGFIHRDLKPSNLMVDRAGRCQVIDLGLAMEASFTAAAGGTLRYMAPEQLDGQIDPRSDVWALGATLYEVLTLQEAFPGKTAAQVEQNIRKGMPAPPRRLMPTVPRDLEAVCLQALNKGPGQRYPTAQAFADDLRRWLRSEPTKARPALTLRRLWLWARRNPGWAAALVLILVTMVVAGVGSVLAKMGKAAQRDAELQRLNRFRISAHQNDWPNKGWEAVGKIRDLGGRDDLRDHAAALLVGLDGKRIRRFDTGCASLAFSPDGSRLWMGGSDKAVTIWDPSQDSLKVAADVRGPGSFAFRPDGTALHLTQDAIKHAKLTLWDVAAARVLRTFTIPSAEKRLHIAWALSSDGAWVAGAARSEGGEGVVVVWAADTGAVVWQKRIRVEGLELAPDGSLLAGWDENGRIWVWVLPRGELLAPLRDDSVPVQCVAFTRDRLRRIGEAAPGWLLAAG